MYNMGQILQFSKINYILMLNNDFCYVEFGKLKYIKKINNQYS